ncbi:recombination protein RecR [Bacteroidia bacterium]|nr:recombination protein RecR [Bacteroidia bacterium]
MDTMIEPIAILTEHLSRLPGIGPKTAQRLAYHIVGQDEERVRQLSEAITYAKEHVRACSVCAALTDRDICAICADDQRRDDVLCVVKEARDVLAMERARQYEGKYHVLQGAISPMDGIGPEDIRIAELLERVEAHGVQEVIMATNPDVEGEATAAYIYSLLEPMGVEVTRIAHGIPIGADLEYTDDVTLSMALQGRRKMVP